MIISYETVTSIFYHFLTRKGEQKMKENVKFEAWLGRTAYQLMPDRFYKIDASLEAIEGRRIKEWDDRDPDWQPNEKGEYVNDYYYGGNLKGVEAKLKYLKDLGFDMIYMTPIEESFSYHHYDVGDQERVDPWLGDWGDFENLCKAAHNLDMLIMVDLVFNQTGIHSKYYESDEYRDWYKYDSQGNHICWYNFKDMPECNTLNKSYQDAMTSIVEKYLENGADGIRLDLAEIFPREFLLALQRVKKKYPNALFVGEMWNFAISEDNSKRETSKVLDGELDSVMNYPIADAILRWVRYGNYEHFKYNFKRVYNTYPQSVQNVLLNNIGTHDTPTTMTMLIGERMNQDPFSGRIWDIEAPWRHGNNYFDTYGFRKYESDNDRLLPREYEIGKKLTKLALAIMYNLPGISCVFQGTEIAETGYKDPFCRKPYNWKNNETDMKEFVTDLGMYRKENKDVLATGKIKLIRVDNDLLIFERYTDDKKRIIFIANRTEKGKYVDHIFERRTEETKEPWVGPYGYLILRSEA